MADRMHASPMRRIWTIAFREFRHTVITKGFIFGALVMHQGIHLWRAGDASGDVRCHCCHRDADRNANDAGGGHAGGDR